MLAVIAMLGAVTPLRLQRPIAQREGWVSLLNVSSPFIHQDTLGYLVGSLIRDSVMLIAKLGSSTFDLELFLVQNATWNVVCGSCVQGLLSLNRCLRSNCFIMLGWSAA